MCGKYLYLIKIYIDAIKERINRKIITSGRDSSHVKRKRNASVVTEGLDVCLLIEENP